MDEIQTLQNQIEKDVISATEKTSVLKQVKPLESPSRQATEEIAPVEPQKIAAPLEQMLNSSQTSVQFGVSASDDGSGIKFKVVDKKTGEILREFPREDIQKIYDAASKKSGSGILIDSVG